MEFKLFDSHCHLYMPQFDADRDVMLARMQQAQMGAVVIGVDLASSRAALELAKQHDFLWASVGLHPNDNVEEKWSDISAQMEELAKDPKVVAIGECGLDYYRSEPDEMTKAAQRARFLAHIDLAQKVKKPLVIHCRDAHVDLLAILAEQNPSVPVVIHFFTGTGELAQKYLSLGCYLSFPGPVTYTDMYDESIKVTPLEKMLIETDSPFAAPVPHRGKRNEPEYVAWVAEKAAQIKGISASEVGEATVKNALEVFGISR